MRFVTSMMGKVEHSVDDIVPISFNAFSYLQSNCLEASVVLRYIKENIRK